jgi:hypothetical protein
MTIESLRQSNETSRPRELSMGVSKQCVSKQCDAEEISRGRVVLCS